MVYGKRIFKTLWFLLLLVFFSRTAYSQDGPGVGMPKVFPPSPNAAALGTYGNIPVGLYTGIPDIQIPLFTLGLGQFSLPISLSYHSSGLKVEEKASWTGLGWTLNAGGIVTRTMNSRPDEYGYWGNGNLTLDSLLWSDFRIKGVTGGELDIQPDFFYFNFAGRSGKFIIDALPQHNVHIIPFQPLKIEHYNYLDSLRITDENGYTYIFNDPENTHVENDASVTPTYKSSWYLSRIATPYGDINFSYKDDTRLSVTKFTHETYSKIMEGTCIDGTTFGTSSSEASTRMKILTTITSPSFKVNFFSSPVRKDILSCNLLDSIVVTDNRNAVVRRFRFSYGYFGNETSTNPDDMRLRLDKISEIVVNGTEKKEHSFEYFSPEQVPAINSKSQDSWGYYNGKNNNTLLPKMKGIYFGKALDLPGADRNPDAVMAQTGVLKKIVYPTGAYSEFIYEGNDYGYRESKPIMEETLVPQYESVIAMSSPSNIPSAQVDFTLPFEQDVVLKGEGGYSGPAPIDQGPTVYFYKIESNGTLTKLFERGLFNSSFNQVLQELAPGNYRLKATVDGSDQYASIGADYFAKGDSIFTKNAGGLRIKNILNYDPITGKTETKRFRYKSKDDPRRSSGHMVAEPINFALKSSDLTLRCKALLRSSFPQKHTALTAGTPIGYTFVVEEYESGEVGRKESTFSSLVSDEYKTQYLFPGVDLYRTIDASEKYAVDFEFMRGRLMREDIFNREGGLVKSTHIIYNINEGEYKNNANYFEANVIYGDAFRTCPNGCGGCNGDLGSCVAYNYMNFTAIPAVIICPWIYETQREETTYSNNGTEVLQTLTKYFHDNASHGQITRTEVSNSKKEFITTRFKYAPDYNFTTAPTESKARGIKYLQDKHVIAPIIENFVQQTIGSTTKTISGSFTSYKTDKPFPDVVYKLEAMNALTDFSPSGVSSNSIVIDNRYKPLFSFDKYDNNGNILQRRKEHDLVESYLWGYNNQYPVAVVKGVTYDTAVSRVNTAILNDPSTDLQLQTELNKLRTGFSGKLAIVSSYTYKPLFGMTSEADASGKTVYYEYDGFGRLRLVKDQNGKILKQYSYQYLQPITQ